MTIKEKYRETTEWQHKVHLINFFHCLMSLKHNTWTVRKTAKYFEVSMGLVSENLMLSKHFNEVRECKSRNEALLTLRARSL